MKKLIVFIAVTLFSTVSLADPAKHGCGWGSLLFEGKSGLPVYLFASSTNLTAGNASFGMTSGTNGCQTHHPMPYGGKSWFAAADFSDDLIENIAQGEGEALDALAEMIGIEEQDRPYFNQLTHDNFAKIVPSSEATGLEVMVAIDNLIKSDPVLSKYAA